MIDTWKLCLEHGLVLIICITTRRHGIDAVRDLYFLNEDITNQRVSVILSKCPQVVDQMHNHRETDFKNFFSGAGKNDSRIKRTGSSLRRSDLDSQHLLGGNCGSQQSVALVPEDPMPSPSLLHHCAHIVHRKTCRQSTHTCETKIKVKILFKEWLL